MRDPRRANRGRCVSAAKVERRKVKGMHKNRRVPKQRNFVKFFLLRGQSPFNVGVANFVKELKFYEPEAWLQG